MIYYNEIFKNRFYNSPFDLIKVHINVPSLLTTQSQLLRTLKKKTLENTVGKEENAGDQHFLSFPTVFSVLPQREIVIVATFNLLYANAFNLIMSKNLLFCKVLIGESLSDYFKTF